MFKFLKSRTGPKLVVPCCRESGSIIQCYLVYLSLALAMDIPEWLPTDWRHHMAGLADQ